MKRITSIMLSSAFIIGLSLMLFGCSNVGPARASYRQISQAEAARLMESEKDYIILDVRRADEFAEKHILGAVNIPNESIGTDPIAALPDKDQLIMVYCRSGNRSKQASGKLAKLGYTNIVEFGGIITWTGETASGGS